MQRAALRIILGKDLKNYEDALIMADLESLENRREMLCQKFAEKALKNDKTKDREKVHCMKTRHEEQFCVDFAHT